MFITDCYFIVFSYIHKVVYIHSVLVKYDCYHHDIVTVLSHYEQYSNIQKYSHAQQCNKLLRSNTCGLIPRNIAPEKK